MDTAKAAPAKAAGLRLWLSQLRLCLRLPAARWPPPLLAITEHRFQAASVFAATPALAPCAHKARPRSTFQLAATVHVVRAHDCTALHVHIQTYTHRGTHTHTRTHTHTLSPIPTTQAVYRHLLPASPPQSVCFTSCPFRVSSCPSSAPIRPAVALLRTCTSAAPSLHTCMRLCRARPTSPLPTALKCRHTAAALQTSSQSWRYPRECVCVCEYV